MLKYEVWLYFRQNILCTSYYALEHDSYQFKYINSFIPHQIQTIPEMSLLWVNVGFLRPNLRSYYIWNENENASNIKQILVQFFYRNSVKSDDEFVTHMISIYVLSLPRFRISILICSTVIVRLRTTQTIVFRSATSSIKNSLSFCIVSCLNLFSNERK